MVKYIIELKNRFFLLTATVFSTFLISYIYKEVILFLAVEQSIISTQYFNMSMFYFIFTNVSEIFHVYLQLLTFVSMQVGILYFIYHFFIFFSFALFESEFSTLSVFIKISTVVWVFSVILAHLCFIPLTWDFFLSFQTLVTTQVLNLHFEAKLNEYLDFYIMMYYLSITYCQLFTVLFFFISSAGNVTKKIKKFRKLYYYVFFIFSTLVSPPDVFSQIIVSITIIIFFEFFIAVFICKTFLIR